MGIDEFARIDPMSAYHLLPLDLSAFKPGMTILDVGCGYGKELLRLSDAGCLPIGIDPFVDCVDYGRKLGFTVFQGYAEHLPFTDESIDGVISQVALPYTNDAKALREISRILKPGGSFSFSTHGLGYYLLILSQAKSCRRACYALRSMANTWLFRSTGKKFRGAWGDTIYQSTRQIKRLAQACGLELTAEIINHRYAGLPVYLHYTLQKPTLQKPLLAGGASAPITIDQTSHPIESDELADYRSILDAADVDIHGDWDADMAISPTATESGELVASTFKS